MVVLWIGMLVTVAWVIVTGMIHFDARTGVRLPPAERGTPIGLVRRAGHGAEIAMYDFWATYQICYLGDEVADPSRTLPRSILISTVWRRSGLHRDERRHRRGVAVASVVESNRVASDLMLQTQGQGAATIVTAMIVWTAVASTFAALLGYSRIPYASARAGPFLSCLRGDASAGEFPHRSLLLVSGMAMIACLADLETVIAALLIARILIQFVGQIVTVVLSAIVPVQPAADIPDALLSDTGPRRTPGLAVRFRCLETGTIVIYGLGSILLGILVFSIWDRIIASVTGQHDHRSR